MSFFDDLSSLCAKEMSEARKTDDADRKAAVVEALATMLGRTIALATNADPKAMDELLMGCEGHMNREAADFAQFQQLVATLKLKG